MDFHTHHTQAPHGRALFPFLTAPPGPFETIADVCPVYDGAVIYPGLRRQEFGGADLDRLIQRRLAERCGAEGNLISRGHCITLLPRCLRAFSHAASAHLFLRPRFTDRGVTVSAKEARHIKEKCAEALPQGFDGSRPSGQPTVSHELPDGARTHWCPPWGVRAVTQAGISADSALPPQ